MSTATSKKNGIKISSHSSRQVIENKPKTNKISTRQQSTERKEEKDIRKNRITPRSLRKYDKDEEEKLHKTRTLSQKTSIQKNISTPKISTKSRQEKPTTPPSNRVTKTQYFPSKKLYSNALKTNDNKSRNLDNVIKKENIKPMRNIKKTTSSSLNSTQKKQISETLNNTTSPEVSSVSERPGTATLRKGSIVNANIVGPDVPKAKVNIKKESPKAPPSPEEINYEDDFDSYESDFEGYQSSGSSSTNLNISEISNESSSSSASSLSARKLMSAQKRIHSGSTDDEKKLDSGNYELPEYKHKQILDNIKESIEKENANLNRKQNQSNLASLSDEGFEDAKSLQFINFLGAQKKYQHRKSIEKQRKRGEEILNMIRLDTFSFTLLDLPPVPYEIFIKNFGKSNTVQTAVQTGEDNISDEVQTEEITEINKWTQHPIVLSKIDETNPAFWDIYKCNYLGVGEDTVNKQNINENYNENKLEKFLLSAGNLILNIQAENNTFINDISERSSSNIPFSKGHVLFKTQTHEILKNRSINNVCFSLDNSNKILTVHSKQKNTFFKESIICLWNISNPKEPEMLLTAYGEVTCCSFGLNSLDLIFGGLDDGSIAIWDTKEHSKHHKNINDSNVKDKTAILLRTATYTTEIKNGHSAKIISIHSLPDSSNNVNLFDTNQTKEICSLDEKGDIIVWSVIIKQNQSKGRLVDNQGLAHWGLVMLVKNTTISLQKLHPNLDYLHCTDSVINYLDPNHIYISTNYGFIIHCMTNGARTNVKKFLPGTPSQSNCLETCPFSPLYILCGFDNGNLSFYSRSLERPLMTMSNKECDTDKSKIQLIQWSYNRPLVFYTKDITNTIHVWDLKASDMFPTYSIPFKDNIVCMKLSPTKSDDKENQKTYMIIATDAGAVHLHLLNDEHGKQSLEDYKEDTRKFLNYINRYV